MSDTLLDRSPLPWPVWGVLTYSAQALSGMLICKFALIVVGRYHGAPRAAANLLLIACVPLLALALVFGVPALELLVLVSSQAVALAVEVITVRHGLRSPELEKRVLALGMLGMAGVLLRDAFVLVIRPYTPWFGSWGDHYGEVAWARYAWVVFGAVLARVIAERMRRVARQLADANRELVSRLAAQQAELNGVFEERLEAKRQ